MNNQLIENTKEYITGLFENNSGGHDVGHTLRVYRNAMEIAEREASCDKEIVALAALLHDADDHKLFDTKDNYNARSFLKSHHYPVKDGKIIMGIKQLSGGEKSEGRFLYAGRVFPGYKDI